MVKAELDYNPYLLETKIKFNGQRPRINSLVEKYEMGALRDWIDEIPAIFYDEMNGYNFELEFTGTVRDFDELRDTFERKGIDENLVHLFHKNVLVGRDEKIEKLEELLEWLECNRNDHFDYDSFKHENKELLEGLYSFVVINGRDLDFSGFEGKDVSVELIDDYKELDHTELTDTPILINVNDDNYPYLASIILPIIRREDVNTNQLFFLVEKPMNPRMVERTIIDTGIEKPQMVTNVKDEVIKRYLEIYPYSDYIYESLRVLRKEADRIAEVLEEENRKSAALNKEVYEKIEELDAIISRLKRTNERFENDYNAEIPQLWMADEAIFLKFIQEWRIKKTKITKVDEAEKNAVDFEAETKAAYDKYLLSIDELYNRNIEDLETEYAQWYAEAEYIDGFSPVINDIEKPSVDPMPSFNGDLLEMKDEKYVLAKEGLIEKFFKESSDDPKEMVLETTYYMQEWRNHVYEISEPIAHRVLNEYFDMICDYEKRLISEYIQHLSEEINKKKKERTSVSRQLSEEERQLQANNDWVRQFDDILRSIERN